MLGAVRWARTAHTEQCRHLYGLGMSMGGAALIAASADPGPDGRAIDAVAVYDTYDDLGSLADDMAQRYFLPPLNWLCMNVSLPLASAHAGTDLAHFRPAAVVDHIAPRPLLVIHGRSDDVIGFQHGVRLLPGRLRAQAPLLDRQNISPCPAAPTRAPGSIVMTSPPTTTASSSATKPAEPFRASSPGRGRSCERE